MAIDEPIREISKRPKYKLINTTTDNQSWLTDVWNGHGLIRVIDRTTNHCKAALHLQTYLTCSSMWATPPTYRNHHRFSLATLGTNHNQCIPGIVGTTTAINQNESEE
ncbi:hypothetical protein EVAR_71717_1 [Eumeta japonica]|uniref:Uncharacterized protein n=1 Tax=Eumeta variegata TaxID=151549 RepID=A0A4C1SPB8_EUMVA|nr:hypothetical protein EVAR_71717_1 [Eumeta japonica]